MLVYGDRRRPVAPLAVLRAITASLRDVEASTGARRHDLIVGAFIEASGLAQGIADAEFAAAGEDGGSPAQDAAMTLLVALARRVAASAWSGFATGGPPVSAELMALALSPLPDRVEVKTPEGFAFYAVYPEAYLKAAAERPWRGAPFVIGLRSIGTGLAALVAAVSGAREMVTLRPSGHPFRRELRISEALRGRMAAHGGPFAVVDEGPGLSGSSFGAAAKLLGGIGVAPDRIVLMPSHDNGPGPEADEALRALWPQLARRPATFEGLLEDEPLAGWFEDLTGEVRSIEDISGGGWARSRADAPPVSARLERRKYRIETDRGRWLAKFGGLGAAGEAKFARARALSRAGLTPEALGLRRGFLLERWEAGRPGLDTDRAAQLEQVGRYLGFRALAFPADPSEGASLDELSEMARANAAELGLAVHVRRPRDRGRPVHVDGRLHAWEWLTTADGQLLKTDAVDHSAAHDLIGCQDIAWDIAGARVELGLNDEEVAQLCEAVARICDRPVDRDLLAFFDVAYPAFQAGLWSFAGETGQVARYAARLR